MQRLKGPRNSSYGRRSVKKKIMKAVIFDLDGVIVTTDDCHFLAWKRMSDEEGIYFDKQINERLRGISRKESLNIILERAPRVYSEEEKSALCERKNGYYTEYIKKLTPQNILSGVMENLERLRKNGILIAIGSSSKNTPLILRQIGLEKYFDAVADGNKIKHSKPDPEVFLTAADMLGVAPSECLVVEDADAGIISGKRAGMKTFGVGNARGGDYYSKDLSTVDLTDYVCG